MANENKAQDNIIAYERFGTVLLMAPFLNLLIVCFIDFMNQTIFEMPISLGLTMYLKYFVPGFPQWGLILIGLGVMAAFAPLIWFGLKKWFVLYEIALGLYLADTIMIIPRLAQGEISVSIFAIIVHLLFLATGVLTNVAYFKRKSADND